MEKNNKKVHKESLASAQQADEKKALGTTALSTATSKQSSSKHGSQKNAHNDDQNSSHESDSTISAKKNADPVSYLHHTETMLQQDFKTFKEYHKHLKVLAFALQDALIQAQDEVESLDECIQGLEAENKELQGMIGKMSEGMQNQSSTGDKDLKLNDGEVLLHLDFAKAWTSNSKWHSKFCKHLKQDGPILCVNISKEYLGRFRNKEIKSITGWSVYKHLKEWYKDESKPKGLQESACKVTLWGTESQRLPGSLSTVCGAH
ncbi:hypothetical protein OE88DRAFT_1649251 [Heliocybe sulcata]|uniref:Uncharacterized protein n=1 Tax=Heliocybe sulcata TaxID=5364 RepID=A0A5C3ML58_9AGAM|nr:hypothetical protein OE88DRAFT_1649251 [Heliocybe sulcata]